MNKKHLFILLLFLSAIQLRAQSPPEGIPLQGIVATPTEFLANESVDLTIGIITLETNGTETISYEETHQVSTNQFGLYTTMIGEGTPTSNGANNNFADINWANSNKWIQIQVTANGTSLTIENHRLYSVPYTLYAKNIAPISITTLTDVNATDLQSNEVLKWNGTEWVNDAAINDADFAMLAQQAANADTATVALYGINSDTIINQVNYAFETGNVNNANSAITANLVDTVDYTDSAIITDSLDLVLLQGNDIMNELNVAVTNDQKLIFKSNNQPALTIDESGQVSNGTNTNTTEALLHVEGSNGVLFTRPPNNCDSIPLFCYQNTYNLTDAEIQYCNGLYNACTELGFNTTLPISDNTSLMFYNPNSGSLRAGLYDTQFHQVDSTMGVRSFSGGKNSTAGRVSFAWGLNNNANGRGALTIGEGNSYTFDSLFTYCCGAAIGYQCEAFHWRAIAMGYKTTANLPKCCTFAMGYQSHCDGFTSVAIGRHLEVSSGFAVALGNWGNPRQGSFMWVDNSPDTILQMPDQGFQFMVLATGGTQFFSNVELTAGVEVLPGGGAWTSLSDVNRKENFKALRPELVLRKIQDLEISTWNYKNQAPENRHMGVMAQDFHAAFGLGQFDTMINTVDMDGVTLAGIKGLVNRVDQLQLKLNTTNSLDKEIQDTKQSFSEIDEQMDELEARIQKLNQQ